MTKQENCLLTFIPSAYLTLNKKNRLNNFVSCLLTFIPSAYPTLNKKKKELVLFSLSVLNKKAISWFFVYMRLVCLHCAFYFDCMWSCDLRSEKIFQHSNVLDISIDNSGAIQLVDLTHLAGWMDFKMISTIQQCFSCRILGSFFLECYWPIQLAECWWYAPVFDWMQMDCLCLIQSDIMLNFLISTSEIALYMCDIFHFCITSRPIWFCNLSKV